MPRPNTLSKAFATIFYLYRSAWEWLGRTASSLCEACPQAATTARATRAACKLWVVC